MAHGRNFPVVSVLATLLLMSGLVACEPGSPWAPGNPLADGDGTPTDNDTGLADDDDDGQGDDDDAVVSIEAELVPSEAISTVATVTWPVVEGAVDAYVEYEIEGEPAVTAPARLVDDEYQVVLFGLKPDTEYLVWARVEADDEIHTSLAMPFHTGYASVELAGNPSVHRDPERATDGFFVTMAAAARWTALIMDQDYDYVW